MVGRRLLGATLVCASALAGCASGGGGVEEQRLPVRRAVAEAYEELPGAVLSERHFVLEGELRVTVAAPDTVTSRAAIDAGFAVADSVERLLSVHSRSSEVSRINAAAGREPVAVSPWTETVMVAALDLAEQTGGAFDPTVGPVLRAWGFGCDECARPDAASIARAVERVGWRKVVYDPQAHTVFLSEAGMELDLRAAAKGFALDRMRESMIEAGATAGILDLDGDQLFFGQGTESPENLWPVGIADPYDPSRAFARLEVPAGGLSTTSPYSRRVEPGGVGGVGHLIDPRTGRPVAGISSVTVYSRDALRSDILSTALFVLGHERGCDVVDEWSEIGVIFVLEPPPGQRSLVCVSASLRGRVRGLQEPFRPLEREDD